MPTKTDHQALLDLQANKQSDYGWADYQTVAKGWPRRAHLALRLVPPGARVIDLGCGSQQLKTMLPASSSYTPADLVERTPDTLRIDLNAGLWPEGRWDTIYALGLLEYVHDVDDFFRRCTALAPRLVMSYHVSTPDSTETLNFRMAKNSWLSDFSLTTIFGAASAARWLPLRVSAFQRKKHAWQYLFAFEHLADTPAAPTP